MQHQLTVEVLTQILFSSLLTTKRPGIKQTKEQSRLFLSCLSLSSSDSLALHPDRQKLKPVVSKLDSRGNHAATQSLTQERLSRSFLRFGSCVTGLLEFSHQFLHRPGEELPTPAPHWALERWWPHSIVANRHGLLHVGRDHLQPR